MTRMGQRSVLVSSQQHLAVTVSGCLRVDPEAQVPLIADADDDLIFWWTA